MVKFLVKDFAEIRFSLIFDFQGSIEGNTEGTSNGLVTSSLEIRDFALKKKRSND